MEKTKRKSEKQERRQTKYNIKWEEEIDLQTEEKLGKWLSRINGKDDYARCTICNKDIKVAVHGINAVHQHSKSKWHKKKLERNTSTVNPSTSRAITSAEDTQEDNEDITLEEQILNAEAIWSMMVAEHDISFLISDHMSKNVSKMFPDSSIAAGFRCCRTKTKYVICEGIASDLQEKLLQRVQNAPYSIMIDESNKLYGSKFLCILIKFYDEVIDDVTTRFLDLVVCNTGSSDFITQCVVDSINKNNLCFESLIQVMSDSPNVMRGIHKGVVTQISSKYASHIIDIGGCSLHLSDNSIKNSLPELYKMDDIEEFLQDLSGFFSFHVAISEKYSHIQDIYNIEKHRILSYCEVRFLSIYPVVERTVEQEFTLRKLFLEEIPKNYRNVAKQGRVIRITTALKGKFTFPTLHFILHFLVNFQKFEKLFQRAEPTIHLLYDKQINLFQTTLIHFCPLDKIEKLKKSDTLLTFEYNKSENMLPNKDISIGIQTKKLIADFTDNDKTVFYQGIKNFFVKVCDQLKKNLPLKNKYLASLRFLHPNYRTVEGEKMILRCAASMPPNFKLTAREMDVLSIEWKLLVIEDISNIRVGNDHIQLNDYWKAILDIKDLGEHKFPTIRKVVRFALSIAEANGDVERLFSSVSHIISKDRNKLGSDTVKGLLIAKSYLQTNGSCLNLSLDDSMKNSIKTARKKYVQSSREANNNGIKGLKKRVLESSHKTLKEDKKMKELEKKKLQIEKQEEEIKLKHAQMKGHLKQAQSLMEDSEKMSKFLCTEKKNLEKAEKQVQKKSIQIHM